MGHDKDLAFTEMGPTGDLSSRVTWSNFSLAGPLWLMFGEQRGQDGGREPSRKVMVV